MAKRVLSEEEIIKDRLAYLGTLAGGLAHEVRSPLNSIHLNIELLERTSEKLSDEDKGKYLNRIGRIKEEVQSLQKILTEFLQFARPPGVKRLATNIKDFLYDVIEFITPELDMSKINVRLKVSEHDYPILVDRRQMEQVLQNLIFNARDAMPDGGEIQIRTKEKGNDIILEIEDSGEGIDPDYISRIFDAFYTTKETGTGLGLGIARRIIDEHNGRLEVDSPVKDGKGTLFTISLPKEKLLTYASESN